MQKFKVKLKYWFHFFWQTKLEKLLTKWNSSDVNVTFQRTGKSSVFPLNVRNIHRILILFSNSRHTLTSYSISLTCEPHYSFKSHLHVPLCYLVLVLGNVFLAQLPQLVRAHVPFCSQWMIVPSIVKVSRSSCRRGRNTKRHQKRWNLLLQGSGEHQ